MKLEFDCPKCSGIRLEAVYNGTHTCEIINIDEDGDHDYGPYSSEGNLNRIQCAHCGYVLSFPDGNEDGYE